MRSKQAIDEILKKVYHAAKDVLGDKLEKVMLFGSYARGDFDDESDIDIFVLADIAQEETNAIWKKIDRAAGDLDWEYDVIVSIHVTSSSLFHRFCNVMPYFMNIVKDGKELAYA